MKVTAVCFGAMRDFLPNGSSSSRAEVLLPDGATVGDLIDELGAPRKLVYALLVDGDQAGLDRVLAEGAEVTLMPPFTGGLK